jgi:putative glutamine amidotransferase
MWIERFASLETRDGVDLSPHPVHGQRVRPRVSRWWAEEAPLAALRAAGCVPVLRVPGAPEGRPVALVTMDRCGPSAEGVARVGVDYVDAVIAAGFTPRLVPPGERQIEALFDGPPAGPTPAALVIVGGAFDIHPRHYGQVISARVDETDDDRSLMELAMARAGLDRGLPMLGICGGMQVMAVAAGGSLVQDLPLDPTHEQPTDPALPWHGVRLVGRAAALLGPRVEVNSTHHQAVDQPGVGFEVEGWSDDGVVEVIVHRDHPFAWGVQWHPERLADRTQGGGAALYAALRGAVRARGA